MPQLLNVTKGFNEKMLKAILFDLDNTLILFNESEFYDRYFKCITDMFSDVMPADQFQETLKTATISLLQNQGDISNAQYFMNVFAADIPHQREALWQRFLHFYKTEFNRLERIVSQPESLHEVFDYLVKTNIKLVLASNPIFPMDVQRQRLGWAGLAHVPFYFITHIENMSFCKPRFEYYQQICRQIDEAPEACMMVGNDPINDMVAARAGLITYLTTDVKDDDSASLTVSQDLRANWTEDSIVPDYTGPLAGLKNVVERLGYSQ
jgi:HAD superfamily hydrolase (TIGR01549 family)